MDKLYFDDLTLGLKMSSGSLTLDAAAIKRFATEFDPQPFHLDEEAAKSSLFQGLAASGWHTAALTMKLLVGDGAPFAGGIIGAGGELAWPKPTRPGDTLTVHTEVIELTPSRSRPDRGMAKIRIETRNQNGETVQIFTVSIVVPKRPQ